jgi:hypothetical protein
MTSVTPDQSRTRDYIVIENDDDIEPGFFDSTLPCCRVTGILLEYCTKPRFLARPLVKEFK